MWKLVMENKNHPNRKQILMKSSNYELVRYLMDTLCVAFNNLDYRSFDVYLKNDKTKHIEKFMMVKE